MTTTAYSSLLFVTVRGAAGFHSQGPALTGDRGVHVLGKPQHTPAPGRPVLIPCTRPVWNHAILAGTYPGYGCGGGRSEGTGQGMRKKTPHTRPLRRAGGGKGPGARVICTPVRPLTNSKHNRKYNTPEEKTETARSGEATRPIGRDISQDGKAIAAWEVGRCGKV